MRRVLVVGLVAVSLLTVVVFLPRVLAQPAQPHEWQAGTWTVVCKEDPSHSCGKEPGAKSMHLWTVTAETTQKIKVKVVGDGEFPELAGRYHADRQAFSFEGRSAQPFYSTDYAFKTDTSFHTSSFFWMTPTSKNEATGLRRWAGYRMCTPQSTFCYVPCAIHSTCTAKRAD